LFNARQLLLFRGLASADLQDVLFEPLAFGNVEGDGAGTHRVASLTFAHYDGAAERLEQADRTVRPHDAVV